MKKPNAEVIAYLLLGLIAVALMLWGAIMFIASFFAPLPIFNGVILMAVGMTVFMSVRMHFTFLDILGTVNELLKKLNSPTSPQINQKLKQETIVINEHTTPEEIEKIKKEHPLIAQDLDMILNKIKSMPGLENFFASKGIFKKGKDIKSLSIEELEAYLKRAVDENEFEKAAEIRDEIKNRNENKN